MVARIFEFLFFTDNGGVNSIDTIANNYDNGVNTIDTIANN